MSIAIATSARVARVPLAEGLRLGPGIWDDLLRRSGAGAHSPFMTWAWHRAWAECAPGEELDSCQAIVLRSATGDVEALFPFRVHRARFRRTAVIAVDWAIGDLGCPDHLELLASPEADLDALAAALADVPWHVIRLGNVAQAAANIQRFRAACERRGWTVRSNPLWRCPYLELPKSWEAFESSLGPNLRRNLRRYERQLRQQHDVILTDYGPAQLEEGWRHLQRLHGLRWGDGGVFGKHAMERLHRRFSAWLADRGQLWMLTLDLDDTPAAAWYGFSFGDTHYAYQMGWDTRWKRQSVGTVLMGLMIRRAIERGCRTFDFLRGEETYKTVWTESARTCYEIVVIRAGLRGAVLRGLDWVAGQRTKPWLPASARLHGGSAEDGTGK